MQQGNTTTNTIRTANTAGLPSQAFRTPKANIRDTEAQHPAPPGVPVTVPTAALGAALAAGAALQPKDGPELPGAGGTGGVIDIAEETRTKLRILKSTFEEGLVDEDTYMRTTKELLAILVVA